MIGETYETFDDFLDEHGNIKLPSDATLIDLVDMHSSANGDDLAYRYIDYSRERDGEYHELTWRQFGVRLRAVASRLQQVTSPRDRVAVLAPQGLDYVVAGRGHLLQPRRHGPQPHAELPPGELVILTVPFA
ncbi:hypothetical protein AWN90_17905 [Nocardia terpenica]|uniref:AMP-dependent synthetase/ligase domain-containing protein n=1 Tax=Nocardia terpenica TaxID=455432 RepID=A0A164P9E2_9NOCA|nr:hypothetical protein AWN90_17905 [Nocardia terpenica]